MINLEEAKEIFFKHYNKQIKCADPKNERETSWMRMKLKHSFHVLEIGEKILENSPELKDLGEENKELAKVVFLLHDIARFYEIGDKSVAVTTADVRSNHGFHGAEILEDEGIKDLRILLPIKYHNAINLEGLDAELDLRNIPENEQKAIITIAELIKDADKTANLIMFATDGIWSFRDEGLGYSEELFRSLVNGTLGDRTLQKTVFDTFLIFFGWENEIFFSGSKKLLVHEKVNEKMLKHFYNTINEIIEKNGGLTKSPELEKSKETMIDCGKKIESCLINKGLM